MAPTHLSEVLSSARDEIIDRFVADAREADSPARRLSRSLLIDHLPGFLYEAADVLRHASGPIAPEGDDSPSAQRHADQRWTLGYDIESVVREYQMLRAAILSVSRKLGVEPTLDEFDSLVRFIDEAVAEAVSRFVRYTEEQAARQRSDIEFLASAGQLLTSSLDYQSTLTRLTRLIVPQLADWCVVHLEGIAPDAIPIAHVDPSKAALVRQLVTSFPLASDAPTGYPAVMRTGTSELVESDLESRLEALATSDEHRELMARLGLSSWMVVPLRVQSTIIGAITLAQSESGRRYGPADLVLAEELARRAAVAIDNAHVYERSQQERARVEAATRAKDEFVAMVSHELRTPLNVIVGWVRLMRTGSLGDDKRDMALEAIERNVDAQCKLVEDLLDISRVITGTVRLNPSQVDLSNLVDLAVASARVGIEGKSLHVDLDLERGHTVMRGDNERLRQIIWNLLTNAVKFTPKGGAIRITLRRIDSDLELVVKDNGVGIDAVFLPHVFESFRQADGSSTRAYGGLGIGLSITKHLVDLHGGTITARSDGPGRGAELTVRLPVSPLVSTTIGVVQMPSEAPVRSAMVVPDGLEGLRVLLVDDDDDGRSVLRTLLETCGIVVRDVHSADAALAEIEVFRPDVLVSDIGMPHTDGYELVQSVRALKDEKLAAVPAIALTAYSSSADRTRALVSGFNRHLSKPVEPRELLSAVTDLSGRRAG